MTLGLVRPVRAFRDRLLGGTTKEDVLPVLMYHSISDDAEPGVSGYFKLCTAPRQFEAHMQWLADHGWQGVTLSDGLEMLNGRRETARRPVAITFDDGFRDFHSHGAPILARHGFSATMYLPTAYMGVDRKLFNSRQCLTWNEVAELDQQGFEFGSHTVNHPVLVDLDWPEIERELRDSRTELEDRLRKPVCAFTYPFAFPQENRVFTQRFSNLLEECGYSSSVTTVIGRVQSGNDRFVLRRLPVNSADDVPLLEAKLNGSYDWLATAQTTIRRSKAAARRLSRIKS